MRLQVGALAIVAALVYMVLQGAHNFSSYFVTVQAYHANLARFCNQVIRVQGTMLAHSVHYDPARGTLQFTLASGGERLPVVYHGPMPNEHFSQAQAIVKGRLGPHGTFMAQKLEVQCPDHYAPAKGDRA